MDRAFSTAISGKGYLRSATIEAVNRRQPPSNPYDPDIAAPAMFMDAAESLTTGPRTPAHEDGLGLIADTSFDDWYYRIHIIPTQFALGNLVGNQQRSVQVWNAYFEPVTLEDFTVLNGDGILVTEPVNPPAEVKPLKLLTYQFEITTDGPPVIDATAVWTIDGVEHTVPFTGRRIVVFPFAPNWSSPVEETLEWLTSMETTYTGKEQIWEIRSKPRRLLEYNLRIFKDDVNRFDNVLFGWTARMFAVPLWQEKARLGAPTTAGDTSITVQDATNRTFEAGALGLIFNGVTDYEIVEFSSSSSSSGVVDLARPIERNWPAETLLFPMMVAMPEANIPTTRQSDEHLDARVRFTVSPADNYIRLPTVAPPVTYRGVELYTGETNWIAALGYNIEARQDLVDEETGVFRLIRKATYPLIQRGFRWMLKTREDAERLREFFGRRRGRLKPVWIPSGTRDFRLIEDATSAATTIYVEPNDYGTFVNMHAARRDIVIILRDGTRLPRRILSYGLETETRAALILDSALGVGITLDSVKRISYLGFYRLAADQVTLSWRTSEVMVVETNFVLKESP